MAEESRPPPPQKSYDYLLKFLLVGDSDVGKQEILSELDDGALESPFCSGSAYKTTTILLDGKRVKLQLWDTSGQGRFCTIIRSYSRGAQGVLLVYDITNRWSFDGLDRWLKEVDEHAPGVPKVLVGNRLHMEFNRKVGERDAQLYASKHCMAFFEVSSLCNFNILESFCELSRMALQRNGMERLWRSNKVLSLQELCCRAIVARLSTVYGIEQLPLPTCVKSHLKSYAMSTDQYRHFQHQYLHHQNGYLLRYGGNCGSSSSSSTGCYGSGGGLHLLSFFQRSHTSSTAAAVAHHHNHHYHHYNNHRTKRGNSSGDKTNARHLMAAGSKKLRQIASFGTSSTSHSTGSSSTTNLNEVRRNSCSPRNSCCIS